jgi:hypothetical protein
VEYNDPSFQAVSIEAHARRLAASCMRQGIVVEGDPAAHVGSLYRVLCASLHDIQSSCGEQAMITAATLTETALESGLIYAGEEARAFIARVGASARDTHRDVLEARDRY